MKLVLQRVNSASVEVDEECVGRIGKGMLILAGILEGDTTADADIVAAKAAALRIFSDSDDKMNLALSDIEGGVLLVPNFTLGASCRRGKRPDFGGAMKPAAAREMFEYLKGRFVAEGVPVECGIFGADMKINMEGDGPVTIILDSGELTAPRCGS